MTNAAGVILCGGESRRMGRSKPWLPFGPEYLLQRVVKILRLVVRPVVVVAAPRQDVPPLPPEVELVRDEVEGHGPLAGLITGLGAIGDRASIAYVSSCDVPLLTPEFIRQVLDGLSEADIAVPRIDGRLHPLAGAYRTNVSTAARALLSRDTRRMTDLFTAVPTRILDATKFTHPWAVSNANTPQEYAELLHFAEPPSGS